jgi:hypothetical protein
MSDLLVGADPEFFVKKDGKFVSAYGLIEGTKKNPQKVEGGAVQVDGMALEININPAKTFQEFEKNYQNVMSNLRRMVPDEYEFAFVPVADFDPDYIKSQPDEARALGCDPDFNAYTGEANNPPDAAKNFRTASGHFHLGWTEDEDIKNPEHIEACQMMTKQLDCGIGLKGIVYDTDNRRRELYGKAGAYRPKPYGVEYRVLSNFWLGNVNWRKELFTDILYSYKQLVNGVDYEKVLSREFGRTIINDNNTRYAYQYVDYTVGRTDQLKRTYDAWVIANHAQATGPLKAEAAKLKRGAKKVGGEIRGLRPGVVMDIEAGPAPVPGFVNGDWVNFNLGGLERAAAQINQPFPWQVDAAAAARDAAFREEARRREDALRDILARDNRVRGGF